MIRRGEETARLKGLVEQSMTGFLSAPGAGYENLDSAMRYTLDAPGKRIRPVLLLLSCKAVYGDEAEAVPYACAIEFIHNYSLIHDDLPAMDDDDLRRGRPTNHKVFGEAMAILAGDGLLSAAFELMHRDYLLHLDDHSSLERRLRAGDAIAAGCGRRGMVAGQAADIEAGGRMVSAETLDFIHKNKTAALLRAATTAGAWLGGANTDAIQALSAYGENLGLAFQIADDILDSEGETAVIGKTAGKDAKAEKATYTGIHGIEASRKRLFELTEQAVAAASGAPGADEDYIVIMAEMARDLAVREK